MKVEMTFGNWLKRRRRQLELTQKELARRVSRIFATIWPNGREVKRVKAHPNSAKMPTRFV